MKIITITVCFLIPFKVFSQYTFLEDPHYYLINNVKEVNIERYSIDNVKDTGQVNFAIDEKKQIIIEKDSLNIINNKRDNTKHYFFNSKKEILKSVSNTPILDSDKRSYEIVEFEYDDNSRALSEYLKSFNEVTPDTFYQKIIYKYFDKANFLSRKATKTEWKTKDTRRKASNYTEEFKFKNDNKIEYKLYYSDSTQYIKYKYDYDTKNQMIKESDISNTGFNLFKPVWKEFQWNNNLISKIIIYRKGLPTEYYKLTYKK